jgi:hypothetical protein
MKDQKPRSLESLARDLELALDHIDRPLLLAGIKRRPRPRGERHFCVEPFGEQAHRCCSTAKRLFIPTYAYKAGQLYLLYHAAPFFLKYEETARFRKLTSEEPALAMAMFFETGQITKNFGLRGRTLSSLHNDKKRRRDLMFVYHVMDFLVRARLFDREDVCKVKIARFFAEKIEPMGEQLSASKIEKAWNRYRAAAPYIYGHLEKYPLMV